MNNHDEHKVYIGSAYNNNGCLLKRWEDYFENFHGSNVELEKLYKDKNKDENYFLDNFYKPWFAQVTWQMMACDIITIGQQ